MKKFVYITILYLLFAGATISANTGHINPNASLTDFYDFPDDIRTIDVYINGIDKIQMENIPNEGYLDVYSILGVKVTKKNLKTCTVDCTFNLPKGIYILKAGKVAKKIIVK